MVVVYQQLLETIINPLLEVSTYLRLKREKGITSIRVSIWEIKLINCDCTIKVKETDSILEVSKQVSL